MRAFNVFGLLSTIIAAILTSSVPAASWSLSVSSNHVTMNAATSASVEVQLTGSCSHKDWFSSFGNCYDWIAFYQVGRIIVAALYTGP